MRGLRSLNRRIQRDLARILGRQRMDAGDIVMVWDANGAGVNRNDESSVRTPSWQRQKVTGLIHYVSTSAVLRAGLEFKAGDAIITFAGDLSLLNKPGLYFILPNAIATLLAGGLHLRAVATGVDGNDVTVALQDPGTPGEDLAVSVVNTAITIALATDGGGALISTVDDVVAAVNDSAEAAALVTAEVAAGTSGGALAAVAVASALAGGGRAYVQRSTGREYEEFWDVCLGGQRLTNTLLVRQRG